MAAKHRGHEMRQRVVAKVPTHVPYAQSLPSLYTMTYMLKTNLPMTD